MNLPKIIRLSWTFYRNFNLLSVIVTCACLRALWLGGLPAFFGVFWLKIATLGITYYFINTYRRDEYYYYQNLGVSKMALWVISLSFDMIVFIISVILLYKFR